MLEIKSSETKTIYFDLVVEGIEQDLLRGMFRILVDNVEYGFPCELVNDKIKVFIPKLNDILKEGTSGIFKSKLDIMGENLLLSPWEDSIEIKIEPKVIAKPEPIQETVSVNPKVKAYLTSEPKVLVEEKKEKKTSKVNKALRDKML
jgi:hypothetical protein